MSFQRVYLILIAVLPGLVGFGGLLFVLPIIALLLAIACAMSLVGGVLFLPRSMQMLLFIDLPEVPLEQEEPSSDDHKHV